jgi:hypothetical protein
MRLLASIIKLNNEFIQLILPLIIHSIVPCDTRRKKIFGSLTFWPRFAFLTLTFDATKIASTFRPRGANIRQKVIFSVIQSS